MTVRTESAQNRILAVVLFGGLAGLQYILVQGRRAIDSLIVKTECLGHFMATKLLVK